jgi:hypothetical protein
MVYMEHSSWTNTIYVALKHLCLSQSMKQLSALIRRLGINQWPFTLTIAITLPSLWTHHSENNAILSLQLPESTVGVY